MNCDDSYDCRTDRRRWPGLEQQVDCPFAIATLPGLALVVIERSAGRGTEAATAPVF
jgi:hypothetical protein